MLPTVALCVLLAAGHLLRMKSRLLQRLYLPSSVVAGILGLIVIQLCPVVWRPVPEELIWGWSGLPAFLINIVFACLFLGVAIPPLKTVWKHAGPQFSYGQIVAWGQYVVGIGLFLAAARYMVTDLPAMFGGVLPVGFEGGHGTASGLEAVFAEHGWEAGRDFALASATAGIVSAVVVGMALVNWAARKGYLTRKLASDDMPPEEKAGIIPVERRAEAGRLPLSAGVMGSLTLHIVIVGLAILVGLGLRAALRAAGEASGSQTFGMIMKGFPLFPLCMIGGLVVQLAEQKFDRHKLIDPGITRLVMNASLDFLIVAAIATIRVEVLYHGLVPFALMIVAGVLWNVFCVVWLARRVLPDAWFERSIAEMGQSMGVTATGILLLRVVDPEYETPAAKAFAYKQLLHEPFMGGGLWTSTAIPLLALWGGWPVFGIAAGAVAFWLVVTFLAQARRSAAASPGG